jgi:hypothetical protein
VILQTKMEKQEFQRIIEMLAKAEASRKTDKDEIKSNQAELLAKLSADRLAHRREIKEMMKMINSNHNETLACQETEAHQEEMIASHKETAAVIEPETEVKTMACQEMEAHQK